MLQKLLKGKQGKGTKNQSTKSKVKRSVTRTYDHRPVSPEQLKAEQFFNNLPKKVKNDSKNRYSIDKYTEEEKAILKKSIHQIALEVAQTIHDTQEDMKMRAEAL